MRVVIMNQAGADVDLRVSAGGRELYNGAVPKMRLRPAMAFNENFPFEPGVHIVRVEDKTRGETAEQTVELKDHATLIVNLLPNSMELSVTFKKNPKFD